MIENVIVANNSEIPNFCMDADINQRMLNKYTQEASNFILKTQNKSLNIVSFQ